MPDSDSMSVPRIAIIGTGWWASTYHVPSLHSYAGAELTALCDTNLSRAEMLRRKYDISRVFSSTEELIDARVADAVIIATPHPSHFPIAETVLNAGLHVMVEKPLTINSEHAFQLVRAAEDRQLHLSVGYTFQFSAAATIVRDWIGSEIGELVQIVVEFTSSSASLFAAVDDPRDDRPDVRHPATYSAANSGGQGYTQLSHAIAMILWATGHGIESVYAIANNRGLSVDVDDAAVFRLSNGATAVAAATGTVTGDLKLKQHIRYLGTQGVIDHDLLRATARLHRTDGTIRETQPDHHTVPYPAQQPARAFADLVAGNGPNLGPPRPAAATVTVIEAMYESIRSGQAEPVRQFNS